MAWGPQRDRCSEGPAWSGVPSWHSFLRPYCRPPAAQMQTPAPRLTHRQRARVWRGEAPSVLGGPETARGGAWRTVGAAGTVVAMVSDDGSRIRMPTAALGAAGPVVSRIGLGLAALGRPAYITSGREQDLADRSVAGMRARAFSVLDAAYAAGGRYVDAARSYGLAEEVLGGWLAGRGHPA